MYCTNYWKKLIHFQCAEVKNYQACAKLELLDRNLVESLIYQFKALKECNPENLETICDDSKDKEHKKNRSIKVDDNQENSKLFEKHVERNLVENLLESVKKEKIKMPGSKSVDSFKMIEQELHNFDCQGGSEEMFDDLKSEPNSESVEMTVDTSMENGVKEKDDDSSLSSSDDLKDDVGDLDESNKTVNLIESSKTSDDLSLNKHELTLMLHAVNIVDFYLNEVENDAYVPIYEISATAINFWVENKFAIEQLEQVFEKYLDKIFYSLGLLLFG